jgi:hypothetical protein
LAYELPLQGYNQIMSRDLKTEIADSGLRYKSKESGSPFYAGYNSIDTMSCFQCGKHKSRRLGSFKKLIGRNQFLCGECHPNSSAKNNAGR